MTKSIRASHADLAIKRTPTVRREEYLDYMTFRRNERPLFTELFGPIVGLKDEWRDQGATEAELDFSAFQFRLPMTGRVPVSCGWMGGSKEVILEETDEYIIGRDGRGRTVKLFKAYATIPLPLDHPVKDMDDWRRIKPHYEFSEERFGDNWAQVARDLRENGQTVGVGIPGGFDEPRQLMGEAAACEAYYDQPELIHDILDTIGDTAFKVLDRVSREVQIDLLSVHEDMAGKSGSLPGPKQLQEFTRPYFRRIWDMLEERGAQLFFMDTDGDINAIIPDLLDAGLNFIGPMEPAANMDIVELREKYGPRLAFSGGLDKHVVRGSEAEIEAELEYKVPAMIRTGGCLLGLDHRIPNGTPLERYRFYHRKVWEIIERETKS